MSLKQVNMRLSCVCGLHLPVGPPYNTWAPPDEAEDGLLKDLLKHPPIPEESVVDGAKHDVPDGLGWIQVWGRSVASVPSSRRNQ